LYWRLVAPGKYLLLLDALQTRVRKPLKMKQKEQGFKVLTLE
jgi:hypothetical protein